MLCNDIKDKDEYFLVYVMYTFNQGSIQIVIITDKGHYVFAESFPYKVVPSSLTRQRNSKLSYEDIPEVYIKEYAFDVLCHLLGHSVSMDNIAVVDFRAYSDKETINTILKVVDEKKDAITDELESLFQSKLLYLFGPMGTDISDNRKVKLNGFHFPLAIDDPVDSNDLAGMLRVFERDKEFHMYYGTVNPDDCNLHLCVMPERKRKPFDMYVLHAVDGKITVGMDVKDIGYSDALSAYIRNNGIFVHIVNYNSLSHLLNKSDKYLKMNLMGE